ncbi:MAG: repressor LexA [Geobacteraceae bacterium GWF2_54_21]|nr:MAG: repressor LexA [Geobacteraceae bacterium GWF2_54_21]
MEELTPKQKQVLDFVSRYLDEHGCPPTLREISEHICTKGTATAMLHLEALERKGQIQRREGSRGIALTNRPNIPVPLPIVGTVRAGVPEPAIEDISGYISVDPSWIKGTSCFFLHVKGDSMVDAGILDGDLALIRPQVTADDGDIVVAMMDGEATLKHFYREEDHIRLEPRNSNMATIILSADTDVTIIGKLLKTIRNYS